MDRMCLTAATKKGEQGFTLIEIMIASAILATGLMALAASVLYAQRLNIVASETHQAVQAARSLVENMRGQDFRNLYIRFNEDPLDDPNGMDTAPGNTFAIDGLAGLGGLDAGVITLDLDETALETDLNGDGDEIDTIENSDVESTYQLLPITVNITWRGQAGRRTIRISTRLSSETL